MPTYLAYTDLQNLTGTTLSQAILEAIINAAEREFAAYLTKHGATGSASDGRCIAAATNLAIAKLATRLRMDGTKPNQLAIDGTLTMADNVDAIIAEHKAAYKEAADAYIHGDPYGETAANPEASIVRQDHQMGSMKQSQHKVPAYHDRADEYQLGDDPEVTN